MATDSLGTAYEVLNPRAVIPEKIIKPKSQKEKFCIFLKRYQIILRFQREKDRIFMRKGIEIKIFFEK